MSRDQMVPLGEVGDMAGQDPPFPGRQLIDQARTLGVKVDAQTDWAGRPAVTPAEAKRIVDAIRADRAENHASYLRRIDLEQKVRTARTEAERRAYQKAYAKEQRQSGLQGTPTASARGRDALRRFAERLDAMWSAIVARDDVVRLERQLEAVNVAETTFDDEVPADTSIPEPDHEGVPL